MMTRTAILAAALAGLAVAAPLPKDRATKGGELEGVWEQTLYQVMGAAGAKPREKTYARFDGKKMSFFYEGPKGEMKRTTAYWARVNNAAKPATLDLRLLEDGAEDVRGIYKIEDGVLYFTYIPVDDDKVVVRPKGFALDTPGQMLMILKRAKSPPKLPE
jgi:uncharacterized protein (TIGR03067 family)